MIGLYIFVHKHVIRSNSLMCIPNLCSCKFVEVEAIDALEIDTPLDLELARFLVQQLE